MMSPFSSPPVPDAVCSGESVRRRPRVQGVAHSIRDVCGLVGWGGMLLAVQVAMGIAATGTVSAEQRPNVLWIITEDMGPELSAYGTPEASTPVLDDLASRGMLFERAFSVTPVCSTNRSSLMTGMYAFSIDAQNHRSHRNDDFHLPEGVHVITDYFRDAGYLTANVKQVARQGDDPELWNAGGKTDWNFQIDREPFDTDDWSDLKSEQPFFAQINFSESHRGGHWRDAQTRAEPKADPAKVKIPSYYPDHPLVREDWAEYLNAINVADQRVGYVLDRLEEDGLADDTIVMFFSDHGRAMVRGKQWPYDSGLQIPLIVHFGKNVQPPENYHPGSRDGRLVTSIDLAATALHLAGIDPPMLMQGRVFLGDGPIVMDRPYAFAGRDRGDETVDMIRTARDKRYRYIRNYYPERPYTQLNRYKRQSYPVLALMGYLNERGELQGPPARWFAPTKPAEELYDTLEDPYETVNLADDPDHTAKLQELRGVLEAWRVTINDQGRFPEDPAIIEASRQKMERLHGANGLRTIEQVRARIDAERN